MQQYHDTNQAGELATMTFNYIVGREVLFTGRNNNQAECNNNLPCWCRRPFNCVMVFLLIGVE